ncbi:MAG: NAD-dependent epimerase/dehydratase family protein [bacterium]
MSKKVFVTGATGFIGSHLVDQLVAAGYQVTVLVRKNSDLTFLPLEKIICCEGELRDPQSLEQAMKGHEAVFHLAAKVTDWGDKKDFYTVNVQGTINVIEAARRNQIKNIMFVGTAGVLGEENCPLPKPENAPYKPRLNYFLSNIFPSAMNYYRESKMEAEKEAIKLAQEYQLNLTVIRPVWVYGLREFQAGPFEYCQSLLHGLRFVPMGKNNRYQVIFVKDLAKAILATFQQNLSGLNIFNVGNVEILTARQFFGLFARLSLKKEPYYLPEWLFFPAGVVLELLAKLFRAKKPFILTRARVKMFYCHNVFDVSRIKQVVGFVASTPLAEGVNETIKWWQAHGYFDRTPKRLRQRYIVGLRRKLFDLWVGVVVATRYFRLFILRRITLKQYSVFLKRVIELYKLLKNYKVVQIDNSYKLHLYLPAFPNPGFFKAIDKFLFLDERTYASHVVLSMTKACAYNCQHCYQKKDKGEDLPEDKLIETAQQISEVGVSMFDIEGGEPLLKFERLERLVKSIDKENEIWINTTGHTLTLERAKRLKAAGLFGAMISIHHWQPAEHDKFVGKANAFFIACQAIRTFHQVGIATTINACPSLELIEQSGVEKLMQLARELGCAYVQIIHEKPAGGWIHRLNRLMDPQLLSALREKHLSYNTRSVHNKYPSLSMQVYESCPNAFGCTAGGIERFYVNAYGEVQPCEFLNVSFGNVMTEDFSQIYQRMRARFSKPRLNWLCNTEAALLSRCLTENHLESLPLNQELSCQLMDQWDRGGEVPLYQRMKLCEKV